MTSQPLVSIDHQSMHVASCPFQEIPMSRQDFTLEIARNVDVRPDFHRKRAVISCETKDGRSIHLEADFQTLFKIHDEIRKQLEAP
jgi:hypothetical protein